MDQFFREEESPKVEFLSGTNVAHLFAEEWVALATCQCMRCQQEDEGQNLILSGSK